MEFFGLDIGSRSIKLVQLNKRRDGYHLIAFGSAPSTGKGLLSEAESDLVALAEAIKKLRREAKIKTKNVVTALPQDQVFTRVVTIPKLSPAELNSALKWEAESFIPLPLSEVTVAHQVVGQIKAGAKEKEEVFLLAAPKRLIDKMVKLLGMAGLTPVSLETEIISMARSLVSPSADTVLLADLGARATDLAVVDGGQTVLVHSIGIAGETLTRAMETQLGLEGRQAEAYKEAYGADPQKLEGKVLQAIDPVLEKITNEMEKTIQFYQTKPSGKKIDRIVLTGGTAGLPEVATLLTKKLNLEVQIGNPFKQLIKDKQEIKVPLNKPYVFAVAVGLAMKQIE